MLKSMRSQLSRTGVSQVSCMQSNQALLDKISKYKAIVKSAVYTVNAYWLVTYSVAPGVDTAVTVCDSIVDEGTAIALANITLTSLTGQEVAQ